MPIWTHIMNCIVIFADWFFVHTKQVSTKVRTKSSIIFQLLHSSPNISCRWTFKVWISNIIQVADSNLCLTDVWWQLPSPPQPPSPRLQKLTFEFSRRFGDTFEFSLGQIWASGIGHGPCSAYGGDPHTTTVAQFNISTFFTLNVVCFVFIVNLNLTNIFMNISVVFFSRDLEEFVRYMDRNLLKLIGT